MSASDEDIRVRIAGDLADINKQIRQLRKETKGAGNEAKRSARGWDTMNRELTQIRRTALRIAGPLAAAFSVREIQRFARETIAATSTLGKAARTADVSAESVQELRFAFNQLAGVTQRDVDLGLQRFNRRFGLALDGAGEGIKTFDALGISLTGLNGEVRNTEDVLAETLVKLSQIESGSLRSARASQVFGEEAGPKLAGALDGGIERLDQARNLARDLGLVLSEDLVLGAEDAQDRIDQISSQSLVEFQRIVLENVDTIETLAEAFLTASGVVASTIGVIVEGTQTLGELVAQLQGFSDSENGLEQIDKRIRSTIREIETLKTLQSNQGQFFPPESLQQLQDLERQLIVLLRNRDALAAERRTGSGQLTGGSDSTGSAGGSGTGTQVSDDTDALAATRRSLAGASTLLSDEVRRAREALDADFEQNLIAFAEYYDRRVALEVQAVQGEITARRAALASVEEEIRVLTARGTDATSLEEQRAKLVDEITVLERDRRDVTIGALREQIEAEADLAEQLVAVENRLLQLQGRSGEAATRELEAEFEDLINRLLVEGDTAGLELVDRLIAVETAANRLGDLEREYNLSLQRMAVAEQSIQAQVVSGVLTEREGRQAIISLHNQTSDQLEQLIPQMRELAIATGDPEAIARVEQLEGAFARLAETVSTAADEIRDSVKDAGADAFSDWLANVSEADEAWDSFVSNVRRRLADLATDEIFNRLFDGGSGGGGGGGSGFFGFLANLFHAGGSVSKGRGHRRVVDPMVFAGAPRLHNGTRGGLRSNEVPAILEEGEEVISNRDRRRGRGRRAGMGDIYVNVAANDVRSFQQVASGELANSVGSQVRRARNRYS